MRSYRLRAAPLKKTTTPRGAIVTLFCRCCSSEPHRMHRSRRVLPALRGLSMPGIALTPNTACELGGWRYFMVGRRVRHSLAPLQLPFPRLLLLYSRSAAIARASS